MKVYCIGHKRLGFKPSVEFEMLSPFPIEGQKSTVIPDLSLGETFDGRVLSEYTQLFTIAESLSDADPDELIYFFQYRKFTTLRSPDRGSSRDWWIIGTPTELTAYFPTTDELSGLNGRMLLGHPMVTNMAQQYSAAHLTEDFGKFILSLSANPHFSRERCAAFVGGELLYPGPSLGAFQIGMFRSHMAVLREVWADFYANYYVPREGNQRRVGGFLLERLHSFLIHEATVAGGPDSFVHGYQLISSQQD